MRRGLEKRGGNFQMKAKAIFIFFTVMLDSIGLGLVIPVLPSIMRRFATNESQVSEYFGQFIALFALMQFLFSPLMGRLSDRFGRRPILLISLIGNAFDYCLMALAPQIELLFLARIISGIMSANITVANAYIADISDDSNRSSNFGLLSAGFGIGFILGPVLGGLLGTQHPNYPFFAAAAFSMLNFLFGFFVLPESLVSEKRQTMNLTDLNPLRTLKNLLKLQSLLPLVLIYFFFQLAGQVHPSIWTLFTQKKFGWSAADVGLSLAFVGVVQALTQGLLPRFLTPIMGEKRMVFFGTLGQAVCFSAFAIAPTVFFLYGDIFISAIFWTSMPALQSLITGKTPQEIQGEVQGSLMSLMSLASIATPIIATNLFAHVSLGAPYFFAGAIFFLSWLLFVFFERREN